MTEYTPFARKSHRLFLSHTLLGEVDVIDQMKMWGMLRLIWLRFPKGADLLPSPCSVP